MKHAGSETLKVLAALLDEIRLRNGLAEKKPGIFYKKGQAFLHFHEDPAGLFMDLRDGADWLRFPVTKPVERGKCLAEIDRVLSNSGAASEGGKALR